MKWITSILCIANAVSFFKNIPLFPNKNTYLFNKININEQNILEVIIEQKLPNTIMFNSSIFIEKDIDTVWKKMTDYNNLSSFIPNLNQSYAISTYETGNKTYTKVFQQGSEKISSLNLEITAEVIMNMHEEINKENKTLYFTLEKSNFFSTFYGSWILLPNQENSTILTYILYISPKFFFPFRLIIEKIKKYVKDNLYAIKSTIEHI